MLMMTEIIFIGRGFVAEIFPNRNGICDNRMILLNGNARCCMRNFALISA